MSTFGAEAGSFTDPGSRSLFRRHFDSLSPGNELKWEIVEPEPGSFDFSHADRMLRFANHHGAGFRGHTLVWQWQMPRWVWSRDPELAAFGLNETGKPSWTRESLTETMRRHIQRIVSHYQGRIRPGMSSTRRLRSTEGCVTAGSFRKSSAAPTSLTQFGSRIKPIPRPSLFTTTSESRVRTRSQTGSIGCCAISGAAAFPSIDSGSRVTWTSTPRCPRSPIWSRTCAASPSLGLELEITELDVALPQGAAVTPQLLAHQAAIYGALAEACRRVWACRKLTVWGLSDKYTWLVGTSPLPFDTEYQPKPAWDALIAALR